MRDKSERRCGKQQRHPDGGTYACGHGLGHGGKCGHPAFGSAKEASASDKTEAGYASKCAAVLLVGGVYRGCTLAAGHEGDHFESADGRSWTAQEAEESEAARLAARRTLAEGRCLAVSGAGGGSEPEGVQRIGRAEHEGPHQGGGLVWARQSPDVKAYVRSLERAIAALRTEMDEARAALKAEQGNAEQLRCDLRSQKQEMDQGFASFTKEAEHLRQRVAEMNEAAGRLPELIAEATEDLRGQLAEDVRERDSAVALFEQERAARLVAEAKSALMRDLLVAELRWHEEDPSNARCTPQRVAAILAAIGPLADGGLVTAPPPDADSGAIDCACGGPLVATLAPGDPLHQPGCPRGGPLPDTDPHAHCDYQAEVVRDTEGVLRVRCKNCYATPAVSDPIGIAEIRSALLDLARLVAIQADTAKDAATARGLAANGIRLDAAAIVAKLGGGK